MLYGQGSELCVTESAESAIAEWFLNQDAWQEMQAPHKEQDRQIRIAHAHRIHTDEEDNQKDGNRRPFLLHNTLHTESSKYYPMHHILVCLSF